MRLLIVSTLILLAYVVAGGQSSVRIIGGVNITNVHVTYKEFSSPDSLFTYHPIPLPFIGLDVDFSISDRWEISSGIGISMMGAAEYSQHIVPMPGVNIDRDLRIGFIRAPVYVTYDLDLAKMMLGYSLNYSFRKNQNYFVSDSTQLVDIYSEFQHAVIAGIRKDWRVVSVAINYHLPLNTITDTRSFYHDWTSKERLGGWQISVGYLLR